jgi:hypothetical protein
MRFIILFISFTKLQKTIYLGVMGVNGLKSSFFQLEIFHFFCFFLVSDGPKNTDF